MEKINSDSSIISFGQIVGFVLLICCILYFSYQPNSQLNKTSNIEIKSTLPDNGTLQKYKKK